jgi:hypothetical protein
VMIVTSLPGGIIYLAQGARAGKNKRAASELI